MFSSFTSVLDFNCIPIRPEKILYGILWDLGVTDRHGPGGAPGLEKQVAGAPLRVVHSRPQPPRLAAPSVTQGAALSPTVTAGASPQWPGGLHSPRCPGSCLLLRRRGVLVFPGILFDLTGLHTSCDLKPVVSSALFLLRDHLSLPLHRMCVDLK